MSGRVSAARKLLISLPAKLVQHEDDTDEEVLEHISYRSFLEVWDGLLKVVEIRSAEPAETARKLDILEWRKSYIVRHINRLNYEKLLMQGIAVGN